MATPFENMFATLGVDEKDGRAVGVLNLVNTTLGKPDFSLQTGW